MKYYAYYNDIDPFVCEWLRELIKAGLIMDGEVDERSIIDVSADDIRGFARQHFFAGIGGWDRALQLAGWPEERPITTASLPCQPFSVAGKQLGKKDERHLFPEFERLVKECRFPTIFGEQVQGAIKLGWLDGVFDALEGQGYTCGAVVLPACSVSAPHLRQRLWWVADRIDKGLERHSGDGNNRSEPGWLNQKPDGSASEGGLHGRVGYAEARGCEGGLFCEIREGRNTEGKESRPSGPNTPFGRMGNSESNHQQRDRKPGTSERQDGEDRGSGFWDDSVWWPCSDGKARRIPAPQSGFQYELDGLRDRLGDLWDDGIAQALTGFPLSGKVPNRVGLLKGAGNSIVPQVAAVFIKAFMGSNEISQGINYDLSAGPGYLGGILYRREH